MWCQVKSWECTLLFTEKYKKSSDTHVLIFTVSRPETSPIRVFQGCCLTCVCSSLFLLFTGSRSLVPLCWLAVMLWLKIEIIFQVHIWMLGSIPNKAPVSWAFHWSHRDQFNIPSKCRELQRRNTGVCSNLNYFFKKSCFKKNPWMLAEKMI